MIQLYALSKEDPNFIVLIFKYEEFYIPATIINGKPFCRFVEAEGSGIYNTYGSFGELYDSVFERPTPDDYDAFSTQLYQLTTQIINKIKEL